MIETSTPVHEKFSDQSKPRLNRVLYDDRMFMTMRDLSYFVPGLLVSGGAVFGGVRWCVACSYAYASLSSVGSV